jgi:hypothetical protein
MVEKNPFLVYRCERVTIYTSLPRGLDITVVVVVVVVFIPIQRPSLVACYATKCTFTTFPDQCKLSRATRLSGCRRRPWQRQNLLVNATRRFLSMTIFCSRSVVGRRPASIAKFSRISRLGMASVLLLMFKLCISAARLH